LKIYASDVRVVPGQNRPVLGEVSIKSTCELVVSTTTGLLDVTAGAEKRSVKQSHSYRVVPEHSVDGLERRYDFAGRTRIIIVITIMWAGAAPLRNAE